MAIKGEQPHFSAKTIDIAEKAQRFQWLAKRVAASRSPAYVQLRWHKLPDVDPDSIDWAETVPGDPKAGRLPRNWRNAVVLGISRKVLAGLSAHDPENDTYAKDVVAYESDGIVRVGVNPDSDHLFGGAPYWYNGEDILTVAMRLGRGPLKAAMGQYSLAKGLMIPEGTIVVQPSIPNAEIANKYPHTQLV